MRFQKLKVKSLDEYLVDEFRLYDSSDTMKQITEELRNIYSPDRCLFSGSY